MGSHVMEHSAARLAPFHPDAFWRSWPLLAFPSVSYASTAYVDASVIESGDGTSWGTAKRTIGEGILAARAVRRGVGCVRAPTASP